MTPELWREVESLFDRVADLPAERRAELLAETTDEIRTEVEKMMAADDARGAAVAGAVRVGEELLGEAPLPRFGPYRAISILGHGGMGAVYLAARDDTAFIKQVAIKVLHTGADSPIARERFAQERRILAGLEHPNIARLIDGGETREGLSYIVLEYVDGQDLLTYARERQLPSESRIELFLQICAAVDYAHRNLVVHRDLKPANILVTSGGIPKLLDFGIAKLLDAESLRTMTGMQALTPQYASPEQVKGEAITTASDVYSLGLILYELLTGRRPYDVGTAAPADIWRVVCESTVTPAGVSGDLDNILLMALRKEPQRRYGSVQALADDLERARSNLPVRARPDTFRYRAGKYVRRNRVPVAAGILLVLALAGGVLASQYQARKAQRRFDQVRSLANSFLFEFHDKIADLPGSTEARQLVVSKAQIYLDSLVSEASGDGGLLTELATAYMKVGNAQGRPGFANLGQPQAALNSYARGIAILEALPRDRARERLLAQAYLLDAALRDFESDRDGALKSLAKSISLCDQMTLKPAAAADYGLAAQAYNQAGNIWLAQNESSKALGEYRKALENSRRAVDLDPSAESRRVLAKTVDRVADGLTRVGDLGEALRFYQEEEPIVERLYRENPSNVRDKRALLIFCQNMGNLYGTVDTANLLQPKKALSYYGRMRQLAQEMFQADSNDRTARADLLRAWAKVGNLIEATDPRGALVALLQTQTLIQGLPDGREKNYYNAAVSGDLAQAHTSLGNFAEAHRCLRQSAMSLRQVISNVADNSDPESAMAVIYNREGDLAVREHLWVNALQNYQRALVVAEKQASEDSTNMLNAYNLAYSYERLGRMGEMKGDQTAARDWHRKRLALWQGWEKRQNSNTYTRAQIEDATRAVARTGG
ncbi:MAG TPA: serine/threonine-protein kinase [Bryobacteraceae bacterium]|nr:serine/threonine-protein kinase [Bryobacteraceae bacterium]